MSAPLSYYDSSYPPELWETPAAPAPSQLSRSSQGADAGTGSTVNRTLTVEPGTPGTYEPAVSSAERPRNVTELREQARVSTPAPWAEGEYVLVGTSGKRAHWTGEDWKAGESPGYALPWEQPATGIAGGDDASPAATDDGNQLAEVQCAVEGCGVTEVGTVTQHPHMSPAAEGDG